MKMNKRKFYNSKLGQLYRKWSGRFVGFFELFYDLWLSGMPLRGAVRAADGKRATSDPMRYAGLREMFKDEQFSENDSFIDIGCGKGRVLAYMNHIGFKGKITGVEYNPVISSVTQKWTEKHDNIEVICGDAFDLDFNDYNIFYLYCPFYDEENQKFVEKIENSVNHKIRIYYYNDWRFRKFVNPDKEGWTLIRNGVFFCKGPICYIYTPQRYSVWEYTPK